MTNIMLLVNGTKITINVSIVIGMAHFGRAGQTNHNEDDDCKTIHTFFVEWHEDDDQRFYCNWDGSFWSGWSDKP
jgi:hypothetical protein